jgi:hypothetical protein
MNKPSFLLPRSFRFPGYVSLAIGIALGIFRFFFGIKPDFLNMKVFAVYSSYIGNKFMQLVRNNLSEEFTLLFIATGLLLIAFSKEQEETERTEKIRLNAFFISAYINFLFLLFSLFFTFGFAFVYMMLVSSLLSLFVYLVAFRLLILKDKRSSHE